MEKNKPNNKTYLKENSILSNLFKTYLNKHKHYFENNNTVVFEQDVLIAIMTTLQNNSELNFEILIDIIAIDYSDYGVSEWNTSNASHKGYSRGIKKDSSGRYTYESSKTHANQPKKRFAVIYNLLSISSNCRINIKFYCNNDDDPSLPSVTSIWSSADWYEREAYDLLGVVFTGHPDLRRLLTDYGFIGHPLRKDFPLIGNVEVNYDLSKERVIYQPVTIKPRVLIPKVIRNSDDGENEDA